MGSRWNPFDKESRNKIQRGVRKGARGIARVGAYLPTPYQPLFQAAMLLDKGNHPISKNPMVRIGAGALGGGLGAKMGWEGASPTVSAGMQSGARNELKDIIMGDSPYAAAAKLAQGAGALRGAGLMGGSGGTTAPRVKMQADDLWAGAQKAAPAAEPASKGSSWFGLRDGVSGAADTASGMKDRAYNPWEGYVNKAAPAAEPASKGSSWFGLRDGVSGAADTASGIKDRAYNPWEGYVNQAATALSPKANTGGTAAASEPAGQTRGGFDKQTMRDARGGIQAIIDLITGGGNASALANLMGGIGGDMDPMMLMALIQSLSGDRATPKPPTFNAGRDTGAAYQTSGRPTRLNASDLMVGV